MLAARLEPQDAQSLLSPLGDMQLAVIALSGGADSTCLAWLGAHYPQCKFFCVTVEHGLRPEARAEAEAAQAMARQLGHRGLIKTWHGEKPSHGIQAAAREARYQLLAEAAHEAGAGAILTAHNLEDVAETFLMRLARGSGLDGLSAMAGDSEVYGVRLLRPLLGVSRGRIEATLRAEGLSWSEDPSNQAEKFERVRLRQAMAAHLDEFGLSVEKIALSAERLGRARLALGEGVAYWQGKLWPDGQSQPSFSLALWRQVPEEIGIRLLGLALPGAELAQIEALADWLRTSSEAARTLSGREIRRIGDIVQISAEKPRRNAKE